MLYAGAVEGAGQWIRPDQVTRMTDFQAKRTADPERSEWVESSLKPQRGDLPGRWYAQNTREPIRDETIRQGLAQVGATIERKGLPTTSSKPRYALSRRFAKLFDPDLSESELGEQIVDWQRDNLSKSALARIEIQRQGVAAARDDEIFVTLPNHEIRRMSPGPSSVISKAVIEVFAPNFLVAPALLWLSESSRKVVDSDAQLAGRLGLEIDPQLNLPDIILADVGTGETSIVFVEVVASDGAVTEMRKRSLSDIATGAGFTKEHLLFVTAFSDRDSPAFKKAVSTLARDSFAWFESEPDLLLVMKEREHSSRTLHDLI